MSKLTRYVVTGIHPVLGHPPGKEFTATLPAAQETALIAGGALALARARGVDLTRRKPKRKPAA